MIIISLLDCGSVVWVCCGCLGVLSWLTGTIGGDVLPQIEGSMGLAEFSDELAQLEAWVQVAQKKLLDTVVDFGVDESVQQALQAYKVSVPGYT